MAYQHVLVEHDGPITIVTLNRPEAMNALTSHSHSELAEVFDAFAADPAQWVAIVTGAGERAFCAGNDLKATAAGKGMDLPPSGFGGLTSRFDLDKPVIAAVNGVAMGGGFEIALACDLIVAAETAIFALPEPRVGLAAVCGGLLRLPRAVGEKRAMEIILTARRVPAREASDIGLVTRLVPAGQALAEAKALARTICESSPMSIRASKHTLLRGLDSDMTDAMAAQWRYPAVRAMMRSDDLREGPRAFAEKRAPVWAGR